MAHLKSYSNQISHKDDPAKCRENLMNALANCQAWDQPFDVFKEIIEYNQMSKTVRYVCQCPECLPEPLSEPSMDFAIKDL